MKDQQTMKDLANQLGNQLIPVRVGELCEVTIMQILKNKILVDVLGLTQGIIPEQEFSPEIGELKIGDKVLAYVLTVENDQGYAILSLKRADKERVSKILSEKFDANQAIQIKVLDANKGGLICQFGDYEGFLPVSQLATSHYPKVSSGDRDEILKRLKTLVGQILSVKVLNFEPNINKLIFSEKAAGDLAQQEKIQNIQIGDQFEGEITGIVDFGLFIKTKTKNAGEIEGLVHISEVSWEHVNDLNSLFKIGQTIKVVVISKEDNRLSLSIKKLQPDPWMKIAKTYKVGDIVDAQVTKITPFGAFVKVAGVDGLVHISELGEKISDPNSVVSEGKLYKFKIVSIEPELHKLNLSMKIETKKRKTELAEDKRTEKVVKKKIIKSAKTKTKTKVKK